MEEVVNYLRKLFKNKKGPRIVLANSAGPDSMSLLALLLKLREEFNLTIISAHVNHKVRKESNSEKIFIEKYCKNNDVIFESMEILNKVEDNFQSEARKIRYEFFDCIIKKYDADYLFTAHHGDDLIETILMRIARGSTLKGYGGFEVSKSNIIRPLINVSKEEILRFNKEEKIPYVVDNSNFKNDYTRNRYRNVILPFLKKEDKNINKKYLKFSQTILGASHYIEKEAEKIINDIYIDNKLLLNKFSKIDEFMQKEVIYLLLDKVYDNLVEDFTDKHVENIINLINSNKPNSSINLPSKVKIIKSYNYLLFEFISEDNENNYLIEFKENLELPNNKSLNLVQTEEKNDNNVIRLKKSEIKMPLFVRNRREGDKMVLRNLGYKKIKDIFIDLKIPLKKRLEQPLLVDSSGEVLWIIGYKKSKFGRKNDEIYDIIIKYE